MGRYLEPQGLLEREAENSCLVGNAVDDDPMARRLGHSITYRIAVGPQAGRKVFTLQTLPACDPEDQFGDTLGKVKVAGFSLHAGMAARADEQRKKLERLCRHISRPAVSERWLSLTANDNVRDQLKAPCKDGTTHVIFEPFDFIARLATLVLRPRVNLTRFHGVFAPNSKHRALVTPTKRGKGTKHNVTDEWPDLCRTPGINDVEGVYSAYTAHVFRIPADNLKVEDRFCAWESGMQMPIPWPKVIPIIGLGLT